MKVETRVFDLFDLFFEDRIVDRKLLTYFSIEFSEVSKERKRKSGMSNFAMLYFRRLRKGKKRKRKKERQKWTQWYLLTIYDGAG